MRYTVFMVLMGNNCACSSVNGSSLANNSESSIIAQRVVQNVLKEGEYSAFN